MYFLIKEIIEGVFVMKIKMCLRTTKYLNAVMHASLLMLVSFSGEVRGMDGDNPGLPRRVGKLNDKNTQAHIMRYAGLKKMERSASLNSPLGAPEAHHHKPLISGLGKSESSLAARPRDGTERSPQKPEVTETQGRSFLVESQEGSFVISKSFDSMDMEDMIAFRKKVAFITRVRFDPAIAGDIVDDDLATLIGACRYLKTCSLKGCSRVTDNGINGILQLRPDLKITKDEPILSPHFFLAAPDLPKANGTIALDATRRTTSLSTGETTNTTRKSISPTTSRSGSIVGGIIEASHQKPNYPPPPLQHSMSEASPLSPRVLVLIKKERRRTTIDLDTTRRDNLLHDFNKLIAEEPEVTGVPTQTSETLPPSPCTVKLLARPDAALKLPKPLTQPSEDPEAPRYDEPSINVAPTSMNGQTCALRFSSRIAKPLVKHAHCLSVVPPSINGQGYLNFCVLGKSLESISIHTKLAPNLTDKDVSLIIRTCPKLRVLDLSGCKELELNDEGFEAIGELSNLAELNLSGCEKITDLTIMNLLPLKHLSWLYLNGCRAVTDEGLALLTQMHKLIWLELEVGKAITSKGLIFLNELKELRHLNLWGGSDLLDTVSSDAIATLACGLPNLSSLNLCERHTMDTKKSKVYVREELDLIRQDPHAWLKSQNARRLSISINPNASLADCQVTGLVQSGILKKSHGLTKTLGLGTYLLKKRPTRMSLVEYPGFRNKGKYLEALAFDDSIFSKVSDGDVIYVLDACPNLRVLDLSSCRQISDISPENLFRKSACGVFNNLFWLNLSGCEQITDRGTQYVCALKKLKVLTLSGCKNITPKGLLDLKTMESLTVLDLAYCREITDEVLLNLPGSLKWLTLTDCEHITDLGLSYLRSCTQLQSLDLSGCKEVKKVGLNYLRALSNTMEELDLSWCEWIDNDALFCLYDLKKLKSLNLNGCYQIDPREVPALLTALPNLEKFSFTIQDYDKGAIEDIRKDPQRWVRAELDRKIPEDPKIRKRWLLAQKTAERRAALAALGAVFKAGIIAGLIPSGAADAGDYILTTADEAAKLWTQQKGQRR